MVDKYSLARWRPIELDDLIRLGRCEDGGYVVSRRCIDCTQAVVGLGIFDDWSFEEAFVAAKPQIAVVGVDGSVSASTFVADARRFVRQAARSAALLRLFTAATECRAAIHCVKKSRQFRRFFGGPRRRFHQTFVSAQRARAHVTWTDLWNTEPLLSSIPPLGVFVKMDIEGSEYDVAGPLVAMVDNVNGLAIEFHDCELHWNRFAAVMNTLCDRFAVVHIHGNNFAPLIQDSRTPQALEVSFINRSLVAADAKPTIATYPRPGLDWPCNPLKPDYSLCF